MQPELLPRVTMSCDSGSTLSEVASVMMKTLECVLNDLLPHGFMLGWCFVKDIDMARVHDDQYNTDWAIPRHHQLSHDFNPAVTDMCHALCAHFTDLGLEAVLSLACFPQQHTNQ